MSSVLCEEMGVYVRGHIVRYDEVDGGFCVTGDIMGVRVVLWDKKVPLRRIENNLFFYI